MRYAYYPGCSLHYTAKEYDHSLNAVCRRLDIELVEIKNWFCCGSTSAHCVSVDGLLPTALSMGNLALVREAGFEEVVVPCPSCFSRFKSAIHKVAKEPRLE